MGRWGKSGEMFILSTGKQAHVLAGLLEFIRHQAGAAAIKA